MPNIKAKTMPTAARVIGNRAISADRIENVQGRVSIAQLKKGKCRSARVDQIDGLHVHKIEIGKIGKGLLIASPARTGRCRQSRSDFYRAFLLLRTSSRKLNPARSRIRYLPSRGSFWKKRPVTMFN